MRQGVQCTENTTENQKTDKQTKPFLLLSTQGQEQLRPENEKFCAT